MELGSGELYYLEPGFVCFSRSPVQIRTVLGSCVAVCLWDRRLHCGGMNHFLYPRARERRAATPKHGNAAVTALVRLMDEAGCRRQDLVAQILGGGRYANGRSTGLGDENVRVARQALQRRGIRIVSEDTGGLMGRKVIFDTATGHVAVLKVHRLRGSDWIEFEKT